MLQEVSHIGFLLPVSHVCLQIAFPVSHIGFTISPNFDNLTMKWNWRLICGWITATLCWVWANIPLFPIDFNGKLEIFLKHLKKKKFLWACVCDWTLIIFQDSFALHYIMSTLFLFLKKKIFLLGCTLTQITLNFFFMSAMCHMCQPCWI